MSNNSNNNNSSNLASLTTRNVLALLSAFTVGGAVGLLVAKSLYSPSRQYNSPGITRIIPTAQKIEPTVPPSGGSSLQASSLQSSNPVRVPRPRTQESDRSNLNRFIDQVVIITGGARGIGQACALRFAQEGAFVYLFDLIDGNKTIDMINNNNNIIKPRNKTQYLKVDVTSLDDVNKNIDMIIKQHGYIDVVVQCAGITGVTGKKAHLIESNDFEKVWRVNMFGIFNVCKAVIPFMLKENYGRIINVASISGKEGNPGQISYASSKGAVISATKTLGKDYAQTGITINSIAPAVIQTKMVDAMPESQVNMMKSKIPMGRTGELNEISGVIAFMASEENSFSTGFCFDLTGGRATY